MNDTNPIQKHGTSSFLYAISRALERSAFYGIRAILVLYLVHTIALSEEESVEIYGLFIEAFVFSQILGAVLGDLLIGNKKAIIIGGLLQAAGAFTICIPSMTAIYVGLGLTVLGSGLYSPNLLANFGKDYLNKPRLMDAGFGMFYVAMNLGAMLGVSIISLIGFANYSYGFMAAGMLLLASVVLSAFIKEKNPIETITSEPKDYSTANRKIIAVLASIVLVSVFWYIYEFSFNGMDYVRNHFPADSVISAPWMYSYNTIFIIPAGILLAITWSFSYSKPFQKLSVGFIMGAIAFGLLLFIPEDKGIGATSIFLLSMLILSLAEMHISPILYSILTRYCNPKYLATFISLTFLPSRFSAILMAIFVSETTSGILSLFYGAIFLGLIGITLLILLFVKKRRTVVASIYKV